MTRSSISWFVWQFFFFFFWFYDLGPCDYLVYVKWTIPVVSNESAL